MNNQEKFILLVQEYLDHKKSKITKPDSFYIKKIEKLGFDERKSLDIFLKIDDEWTYTQQFELETKNSAIKYFLGVLITLNGIAIFGYSYIYNKNYTILPYGMILGGIVYSAWCKNEISKVKNNKRLREMVWKSWIR